MSVTYVAVTNYSDSKDEILYAGKSLTLALSAIEKHWCASFRIQKWLNGVMTEEINK